MRSMLHSNSKPDVRMKLVLPLLVCLASCVLCTSSVWADGYTYTYLPVPAGWDSVVPTGINDSGAVVGELQQTFSVGTPPVAVVAGFLYQGGSYTILPTDSAARGINNSGMMVGWNSTGAFISNAGSYTYLPVPAGLNSVLPTGINNSGSVVGQLFQICYLGGLGLVGFLYQGGTYTIYPSVTVMNGINNSGMMVGYNNNGGFIGNASSYTYLPVPTGWTGVNPLGINDTGAVVGQLVQQMGSSSPTYAGFLYQGGSYTIFPNDGIIFGINNNGMMVGADSTGAFIADPSAVPLPPSLLLFAPGFAGLAAIRRRLKK